MQHTQKNFLILETWKWNVLKIEKDINILDEKLSQLFLSKICPFIITIIWDHLDI